MNKPWYIRVFNWWKDKTTPVPIDEPVKNTGAEEFFIVVQPQSRQSISLAEIRDFVLNGKKDSITHDYDI